MAAGAEADPLRRIVRVRSLRVVRALEGGDIDQQFFRRRLAGKRRERHAPRYSMNQP